MKTTVALSLLMLGLGVVTIVAAQSIPESSNASHASNARCLSLGTEADRSACLQKEIDELRQTLELYRDLFETKLTKLEKDSSEALHDGIYAPPKEVTRFENVVASTDMWWGGQRYLGATNLCHPQVQAVEKGSSWDTWFKQSAPAGSVFYAVEKTMDNTAGCKTGPTCDSLGERCETHRLVLGCFVSKAWLDWYLKHTAAVGMGPSGTFICTETKQS